LDQNLITNGLTGLFSIGMLPFQFSIHHFCGLIFKFMSKTEFARTLVTAALPYANGPVHIGHLAGVYLPSDVFVRYKRLKNEDGIF
jgi:hypothetical protein